MVVISTIIIIVLLIVFGCIGLANVFDNNKQNTEQKVELKKEDNKEDDKGYFSGWWKVALVAVLIMFLINACKKSIKIEPNIPNDWNYDGKVDEKDAEEFIRWKIKQEGNK